MEIIKPCTKDTGAVDQFGERLVAASDTLTTDNLLYTFLGNSFSILQVRTWHFASHYASFQ